MFEFAETAVAAFNFAQLVFHCNVEVDVRAAMGQSSRLWPAASRLVSTHRELQANLHCVQLKFAFFLAQRL